MVGLPGSPPPTGNPVVDFFVTVGKFIKGILGTKVAGFTVQSILTAATIAMGVRNFQKMQEMLSKGQSILATKVAQGSKIPVIYGSRRVGSTVVYLDTADNRSKSLFVVYALSVGEVDEIEGFSIELDGNPITDTKRFRQGFYIGSDKISTGAGSLNTADQRGTVQNSNPGTTGTDPTKRYRMVFNLHHGASSQTADPMLTASVGAKWTTAHKLNGIAYIAANFEFDTKAMFKGIPQLTVVVKGKKVYDPRKDGSISGGTGSHRLGTVSTYEWSDNPALCLLDYMTNDEYGKGLGSSVIDLQSFQTSANTADTKIDTPDYTGSYQGATWSTTSGSRRVVVDADTWNQTKLGGELTIRDGDANIYFDGCSVIGKQRYQEYDETPDYVIYLDCEASSTETSVSGTAINKVRRFTCNGLLDPGVSVLENARELLSNMRGILNYNQGKYELKIEDTESSAFTVTSEHIIDEPGIQVNYETKDKKANKVVVEYFNAGKGYELDTVTVYHDPNDDGTFTDYKDEDGGEELELKVNFPYIVNPYVAYNMGLAILKRSRNQKTVSFLATPELYKVNVGDVITVDYSPVGSPSGLYRVEAMDLLPNGLISVVAIQYLDIYTWEDPSAENVEALVNLPQTHAVKAPTGLTFTDSNTSATGRAFLSWNEPTDFPNYEYRISIVDSSSNKLMNKIVDDEFVDCNFLPVGSNYVASVSSINSVGSESDAATLTFSVSTEPVATADIKDDAVTLAKIGSDVQSAINAGGTNSTQLIKSTSAPTTRTDSSALQPQDLWADTDDNNQIYVRNAANNGWEKARDSSLITLYNSLSSTVSTNSSNIATAQGDIVTLTTDTSANATAITNLQSSLSTTNSNVSANASNITSLQTQVTANDGDISSLSSSVTSLQSSLATTNSNVSANASNITSLQTQVTSNDGDISSLSSSLTSLTSTVGSNTSSISTNATAISSLQGNASASYVLQLNANGKVAQMVLESNASSGSGATSTIAFLADTFKIDNDAGSSVSPFVVTGGTVYIDNARITDLSADKIRIDNVTLDTDGSGNLIIKTEGVNTTQIADRATSVFATATQGIGYWTVDNLAQTAIVTTGVFQAPAATGNTFFIIGNTYINANSGSSTADWCELQIQRRSASTSGGVSSAAYSTIATIRARGETGEALQSIIANDAYTANYYYQYRVTLQTNGTGVLYSTRSYGISGIQVIVNYK